jgi:GNAT superfamily N-acetyltransferase
MTTQKSILIRKAIADDAIQLIELNKKYNGEENINKDIATVEKMLMSVGNESVFVAVCGDSLIGFACVQVYRSFCYRRPALELTELYVKKEMRRQKAATLLIEEILKFAVQEDVLEISLGVNKYNKPAINLYKSMGLDEADHLVFRKRYF